MSAWKYCVAEVPDEDVYVLLRNEEEGEPPHVGWAVYWNTGAFHCFMTTDESDGFVPTQWAHIPD